MTPQGFICKWGDSRLRGRQGLQEHFNDLRRLLEYSSEYEESEGDERVLPRKAVTLTPAKLSP